MAEVLKATTATYQGVIQRDVPMSLHTTWKLGGPAERLFIPQDIGDFCNYLQSSDPSEPIFVVGAGSNLLVRDGGIRGTVILLEPNLQSIKIDAEQERVVAEAGVTLARLTKEAHRHGLTGFESLAGIPGTLGGALKMNAGAYGDCIWQFVKTVTVATRAGELVELTAADVEIDYRAVKLAVEGWFVAATLHLQQGDVMAASDLLRKLNEQRAARQPLGSPSCGSVFKNPQGDNAWRVIEAAGLKGKQIGALVVSEKHANFMLNLGNGRAKDAEALIKLVQQEVKNRFGIDLETEVLIVGEFENE